MSKKPAILGAFHDGGLFFGFTHGVHFGFPQKNPERGSDWGGLKNRHGVSFLREGYLGRGVTLARPQHRIVKNVIHNIAEYTHICTCTCVYIWQPSTCGPQPQEDPTNLNDLGSATDRFSFSTDPGLLAYFGCMEQSSFVRNVWTSPSLSLVSWWLFVMICKVLKQPTSLPCATLGARNWIRWGKFGRFLKHRRNPRGTKPPPAPGGARVGKQALASSTVGGGRRCWMRSASGPWPGIPPPPQLESPLGFSAD